MHRSILAAAAVGLAALAASGPAVALGGEAMDLQAARMNALAGGPISARDAELLERYGCESGTRSAFCQGLKSPAALLSPAAARISALAPRSIHATKPFAPSRRMNSPAFLRTARVLVIGATARKQGPWQVNTLAVALHIDQFRRSSLSTSHFA